MKDFRECTDINGCTECKEFYAYWDKVISSWANVCGCKPTILEFESFWFEEQKHLKLHKTLMPEPYWGDIDNNSVVFVNFNPAGSEKAEESDTCHFSGRNNPDTVCGLMSSSYSSVAKSFPILKGGSLSECYKGAEWWQVRVKWAEHFGFDIKELNPFAIELCGWHSHKWCGAKYDGKRKKRPLLRQYIKEYFGPWLERAIKGSKYHVALCVGKEFSEHIVPMIWPEHEDLTDDMLKGTDNCGRKFSVIHIPDLGYIISTWAQGSNKIPAANEYKEINQYILSKIKI